MPIDLFVGGSVPSATLVPSAAVQSVVFQPASLSQSKGDNWPLARGLVIKVVTTFDQAGSGGAAVNWDQLAAIIDSVHTSSPLLGTIHDRNVFTGPVAKHLAEFIGNGYRYYDSARAQISASDGDTAVTVYLYLPFTAENFLQPEGFWPWVGWLRDLTLTVNLAAANALGAYSTGAVTKTSTVVTAAIDAYVLPQPTRFLVSQWNKYQTNAASGNNTVQLQSIGQAQGLSAAQQGCRIAGLFELCNVLGMGGAATGDLFTSFSSSELGQDRTTAIDLFLGSYRSVVGHAGPISLSAAIAAHDGACNPATMAATPNGSMAHAALLYMPWKFISRNQRLENVMKWLSGPININRDFTVTPSVGTHTIVTNEIRELNEGKWSELAAIAGLSNVPVQLLGDRMLREGQKHIQAGVFKTRGA